jgi:CDGSH-type Zn-finger protein/uncharacterized Fe-S cluster protein YjdI
MADTYQGAKISVSFDGAKCIHSRHCVLNLPKVFIANAEGPWIQPDNTDVEELKRVIRNCPSGALTYQLAGEAGEPKPAVNTVRILENGPYAVNAPLDFGAGEGQLRATLCRCGASANKPFCDGSHSAAGFIASGEPATLEFEALERRDGTVTVDARPNGPIRLSGNMEIIAASGRTVDKKADAFFCRCGASANKPYCDGSHTKIGFKA